MATSSHGERLPLRGSQALMATFAPVSSSIIILSKWDAYAWRLGCKSLDAALPCHLRHKCCAYRMYNCQPEGWPKPYWAMNPETKLPSPKLSYLSKEMHVLGDQDVSPRRSPFYATWDMSAMQMEPTSLETKKQVLGGHPPMTSRHESHAHRTHDRWLEGWLESGQAIEIPCRAL